jgi:hypothetical protein
VGDIVQVKVGENDNGEFRVEPMKQLTVSLGSGFFGAIEPLYVVINRSKQV